MAIRRVLQMGNPILRERARPLSEQEVGSQAIASLLGDMVDTLHDYGGIGLAAPQIGESLRLAIIEIPGGETRYGYLEHLPLTVYINPEVEVLGSSSAGYWEGCLSVSGLRGFVERPQHVKISYTNVEGERRSQELQGFVATVFQHEFDHLDGKLFVDRMDDMEQLVFEREYEHFYLENT